MQVPAGGDNDSDHGAVIDTNVRAPAELPPGRAVTLSAAANNLERSRTALVPLPPPSPVTIEPSAPAASIGNVNRHADPPASQLPDLSSLIRMSPELGGSGSLSSSSTPALHRSAVTPPPQQVLPAESPQPRAWRRAAVTPEPRTEANPATDRLLSETLTASSAPAPRALHCSAVTPPPQQVLPAESPQPRAWRRAAVTPEPRTELNPATNRVLSETPTASSASAPRAPIPMSLAPSSMTPPSSGQAAPPVLAPVAPTLPPALDPPDFSTWPKHMVDAYVYLMKETMVDKVSVAHARSWGRGWTECLEAFFEFQRRAGFPDSGPSFPPAAGVRPAEIGMWMKKGRPWKDMGIADKVGFGQGWWNWWSSLLPDSRAVNDAPTVDMDWGKMNKPGRNGFLLVMLSLVWWRTASGGDGGWWKAVTEVSTVLRCMLGSASTTPGVVVQPNPLTSSSGANIVGSGSLKRRREGIIGEGASTKKKRIGR